ncbi:hypothetical protein [Roseobacter sp. S98]|uniref:hypothetical protein n=1 Tax=Roseobacter algicola (ex Choi et al. 2025) (nom. illeg.) TaxID=3092138 RepID=UPI003895C65F
MGVEVKRCARFEAELNIAWQRKNASPYPGQLPISDPEAARILVRQVLARQLGNAFALFRDYPLLALWATLTPLAERYGMASNTIYDCLSDALDLPLHDNDNRARFKGYYRSACRKKGILVSGNTPSDLFFPPLGVADSKLPDWSNSMVAALLRYGPPAIEDTSSALAWQRRALAWMPEALTRPRSAVLFDHTAWYADRITHWRQGHAPDGQREEALFSRLDQSMRAYGVTRDKIVGPPSLKWYREGLSLMAEPSALAQTITRDKFPERITPGKSLSLAVPWPETVTWTARQAQLIPCAPSSGEMLFFDVDTGNFLARLKTDASQEFDSSVPRIVALSRTSFSAGRFGPALPAKDPSYFFAWVSTGDTLEVAGQEIRIVPKADPAISLRAPVLGHAGSTVLRAGSPDGHVEIRVHPDMLGDRVLRITARDRVLHRVIQPGVDGIATLSFSDLQLDQPGDPTPYLFELLIPGASQNREARAEMKASHHIWPGAALTEQGILENVPLPSGYLAARSAGFHLTDGRLTMDVSTAHENATLCIEEVNGPVSYDVPFKTVRLWRHKVTTGDKERVPLGSVVPFFPDDRQDSFMIEAPGCKDDLIAMGIRKKWPFYARTRIEIPASVITPDTPPTDDRIALIDREGRTTLLARICQTPAATIHLLEHAKGLDVCFSPSREIDAVGLIAHNVAGETWEAAAALANRPVDHPLPKSVQVTCEENEIILHLPATWPEAGRLDVTVRPRDSEYFVPETGDDGLPLSVGMVSENSEDARPERVAEIIAEPTTAALQDHVQRILQPCLERSIQKAAAGKMFSPLANVWTIMRKGGGTPRGDLVSAAPFVFAQPLVAYSTLSTHATIGALGRMVEVPQTSCIPPLDNPDPLKAWLLRLPEGTGIPPALDASALDRAFVALGGRLDTQGLRAQLTRGALGSALRLMLNAYGAHVEMLRDFDRMTGQTDFASRLVSLLERFARASRQDAAEDCLQDVVRRTGLPIAQVGEIFTMLIKTAPEVFAYFLTLWAQAPDKENTL